MRTQTGLLAALTLLVAGAASAAPISGVQATLTIDLAGIQPIVLTGSGTVDLTPGGVLTLPAGLVSVASGVVPVTSVTAINSLTVSNIANGSGVFSLGGVTNQVPAELCAAAAAGSACVGGGGIGGVMPLGGVLAVHVIPDTVVIPINLNDGLIGQGGGTYMPFTFDAAPWTTGVARVNTFAVLNPAGQSQTYLGTAAGTSLTLVTTTFISACGNTLPTLATLSLTGLVPEPGAVVLVAAGLAGVLALRRRRRG